MQREQRLVAGLQIEQRDEMLFQRLAAARVAGTGIQGVGPVPPHPLQNEFAVDRLLAAEHQVDLQRLVEETRHIAVGLEQFLQPEHQARPKHALEGDAICVLR